MKIAVTGASGKLGRLVIKKLLANVAATDVVAIVRDPKKMDAYADNGVDVRKGDYSAPESLHEALKNVDRLLLISSSEVMKDRAAQHQAVVQAAVRANVKLLVYTSLLKAHQTSVSVLKEHMHTETAIRDSRIPFVILRNGWYIENYTDNVQLLLSQGAIYGASGDGRIAAASRADLAEAAARVLLEDGHAGKTYELAGSHPFTKSELAQIISEWSNKPIAYHNMNPDQYTTALTGAGLPEPIAQFLVQADQAIAANELNSDSDDLQFLIGHPSHTVQDILNEITP